MTISIQFYAQLRDAAGCSRADINITEGATVADLLRIMYAKFPDLRAYDKTILIGAGVEFVGRDYRLKFGDEIALMPPVQGG